MVDFVIVGAGASGLSLACALVRSPLHNCSTLIIERDPMFVQGRTWSFWTDRPTPFEDAVQRSWSRMRFAAPGVEIERHLGGYRYQMLRGADFRRFAERDLSAWPNVEFRQATVEDIEDGADRATVHADGQQITGRWVFDSRFRSARPPADQVRRGGPNRPERPDGFHWLWQTFRGWQIETAAPVFDPQTVSFLDFRTPQAGSVRFFYVLPEDERRALIEFVDCGAELPSHAACDAALRDYMRQVVGADEYRIVAEEHGASPMTDRPFPRRAGRRVMTIGLPGGRVKPSTGFGFTRIQHDSAAIVRSLLQVGHPFDIPSDSRRYALYDATILDIMSRNPEQVGSLFAAMFRHIPIDGIFRFLDETATFTENLRAAPSLPPVPFVRAMLRTRWQRWNQHGG